MARGKNDLLEKILYILLAEKKLIIWNILLKKMYILSLTSVGMHYVSSLHTWKEPQLL